MPYITVVWTLQNYPYEMNCIRREKLCISSYVGNKFTKIRFRLLLITTIFTMQVGMYHCNIQNIATKELTTAVVRLSTI